MTHCLIPIHTHSPFTSRQNDCRSRRFVDDVTHSPWTEIPPSGQVCGCHCDIQRLSNSARMFAIGARLLAFPKRSSPRKSTLIAPTLAAWSDAAACRSKNVSRRLQLIGRTLPDIHLQTVELRNNDNSHHVTYRPQTTGRFSLPIKELIPR